MIIWNDEFSSAPIRALKNSQPLFQLQINVLIREGYPPRVKIMEDNFLKEFTS